MQGSAQGSGIPPDAKRDLNCSSRNIKRPGKMK